MTGDKYGNDSYHQLCGSAEAGTGSAAGKFLRDAAVIAFVVNESISIVENAGLMGIPIPAAITKGIDVLKQKGESEKK